MKTNEENRKLLSNQIATRNTKEKKAGQVELARKLDANVRVTNFQMLFAAHRARAQDPGMHTNTCKFSQKITTDGIATSDTSDTRSKYHNDHRIVVS